MAASNGTLVISAAGKSYSIDVYTPDATGAFHGYNPTGLAGSGSPTQLVCPVDGAITDYVQVAAPTAVGFNVLLDSAAQPGAAIRYANQLNSLATRQKIFIPVKKGQIISALQF